jgi:aromatic ring-cleaving dioxygenase
MERRFNLIKSDFEKHEKRVLPRFPFCYLTFKAEENSRVYEVKDITHTGMQLSLKDDTQQFAGDHLLKGSIHWLGRNLDIAGTVKWSTQNRLGIEFVKRQEVLERVRSFLRVEDMVKCLKPLHKVENGLELPARLKYWLRADGPIELFVWQHNDGEIAKFQILFLETFVEWEDGNGAKTGRILSKRNVDSPLVNEDEWVFQIDADLDIEKLNRVIDLVKLISADLLPEEVQSFLVRQLS